MKKLFLYCLSVCFALCSANAQLTATAVTNQNIRTVLENNFLGEGVKLDTTHNIYYNGQTVINNNQIGTFVNTDTSDGHIPIAAGIVLGTDAAVNLNSGSSVSRTNALTGASTNSPMLYLAYSRFVNDPDLNQYGNTLADNDFRDVAVLDFWVIPSACEMSFKYSFASSEYPSYVCTRFNDFFGLFVDGPYNEDGSVMAGSNYYSPGTNIAIVPGTDEFGFEYATPIMINTCNNKNSSMSCGGANSNYFRDLRNNPQTGYNLGGCTKKLETAVVQTTPNARYHLQLAICNMSDENLQSAVFFEKNSFTSKNITIKHNVTASNSNSEYIIDTLEDGTAQITPVFIKGCSTDTMVVFANYIADENEAPYTFYVKPSAGSSIVRGTDFDYYRLNGDIAEDVPASSQITIPVGESEVKYLLTFLHNENKQPGTIDTLLFISTDCANNPNDTIRYIMREPDSLICNAVGGATFCNDRLPQMDTIELEISGAVSYAHIVVQKGDDNSQIFFNDTVNYAYGEAKTNIVRIPVSIMDSTDTQPVKIHVEDYCGRFYDATMNYTVISSVTEAKVTDDYICDGDSVMLSCPEAFLYSWTSNPSDSSLMVEGKNKMQTPTVKPKVSTFYYLRTTSKEGCIALDTVTVRVEPTIKAHMQLNPDEAKYSDPQINFMDLSNNPTSIEWDFGDGTTSTSHEGYHTFPVDTSEEYHDYEVLLVVYNAANCPDTAKDTVRIIEDFTFYVPNAFQPGSDNNDLAFFGPKGALMRYWNMEIYNRWGTKVFEGQMQYWDGKLSDGSWAPQGTYVYSIIYRDGSQRVQRKTGTFALIPDHD